ncbi:MAG: transporter ATP-binding protein [Myxococcales bacterium]|nr:transporter ATP-binding protein [Myxococcales bacterium]
MTIVIRLLLRSSPLGFVAAVLCGLASGGTTAVIISLLQARVQAGEMSGAGGALQYLGLCLLYVATNIASASLVVLLSQRALTELRVRLCRRIHATPLKQIEQIGTARLQSILSDDISSIASALFAIPGVGISTAVVLGSCIYMGLLSWTGLLQFVLFLALALVVVVILSLRAVNHMGRARALQDDLFRHFRELAEGGKELKLNATRARAFFDSLLVTAEASRRQALHGHVYFAGAASGGETLVFVILGLLVLFPVFTPMAPAARASYVVVMLFMIPAMRVIFWSVREIARAGVAWTKIEGFGLDLASKDDSGDGADAQREKHDRIEFRGITYEYAVEGRDDRFRLGPIDLDLCAGEIVLVVGGNGGGKTTLAKVLCGLYAVDAGTIRCNGTVVSDENRAWYRQRFSAVFSDFFLFDDLAGPYSAELDARARAYLVSLHLEHKVKIVDGKLSTTALSQGQRKRLALLAAYLEDRPVMVFDEWAADQDPGFKRIFYREILPDLKARGKAVLVISHDDRYFDVADRMLKLEDGKLVDETAATSVA